MALANTRVGLQKDYLVGLDHLRKMVEGVEIELDKVKLEFYSHEGTNLTGYEKYLKGINDKLQYCNEWLQKEGVATEVIDSEVTLVELVNKVQDINDDNFDRSVLSELTEFWEHIKDCLQLLKSANLKYQNEVMKRLESTCNSYQNTGTTSLESPAKYSEEAQNYGKEIKETIEKINVLIRSFTNGIRQEKFTATNFTQCVLSTSDTDAFPILCLIPDISEKLISICRLARQWIDKDETYIHDINQEIRKQRQNTRQKEKQLREQRERRTQLNYAVTDCQHMVKTYRERLKEISQELRDLDIKFSDIDETKKYKKEEARQKEGMIGFLEISISQTKKNFTLQLKKSRILRQLKELEKSLREIEVEIEELEKEAETKRKEREVVEEKIEENGKSFQSLKNDLDSFTEVVDAVQREMTEMTSQLQQLEIIQTFKTSPEKVDDFYDKPQQPVKLAPSLKVKILQRRRLLAIEAAVNTVGTVGDGDGEGEGEEEQAEGDGEGEPGTGFFLTQ